MTRSARLAYVPFLSLVGLAALTTLPLAGCRRKPPVEAPPTPSVSAEPEPPPPPPPPKCEALEEKCEAKADTKTNVGATEITLGPPVGWVYAKEAKLLAATKGSLVFGAIVAPSNKPADLLSALAELTTRFKITQVEAKGIETRLKKKPEAEWKAGEAPIKVWEVKKGGWPQTKDVLLDNKPCVMLLAVTELKDGVVVSIAAQQSDAEGDPAAIKAALETLRGKQ